MKLTVSKVEGGIMIANESHTIFVESGQIFDLVLQLFRAVSCHNIILTAVECAKEEASRK